MKRVGTFILCIIMVIGFTAKRTFGEEPVTQKNWEKASPDYSEKGNLDNLREIHEGTVFLLKRYASLEALIVAKEKNRDDLTAYGIGAASLIPGVGQFINKDYLQGSLLLFSTGISWGSAQQLSFTKKKRQQYTDLLPWYYASLALENGLMTYAMLHASEKSYETQHDKTKALWTGMGSLIPGVGQAINGDWWEAGGLLVAWSCAAVLTSHFEEKIFINGDDTYLVKEPFDPAFALAWCPGGLMINIRKTW